MKLLISLTSLFLLFSMSSANPFEDVLDEVEDIVEDLPIIGQVLQFETEVTPDGTRGTGTGVTSDSEATEPMTATPTGSETGTGGKHTGTGVEEETDPTTPMTTASANPTASAGAYVRTVDCASIMDSKACAYSSIESFQCSPIFST